MNPIPLFVHQSLLLGFSVGGVQVFIHRTCWPLLAFFMLAPPVISQSGLGARLLAAFIALGVLGLAVSVQILTQVSLARRLGARPTGVFLFPFGPLLAEGVYSLAAGQRVIVWFSGIVVILSGGAVLLMWRVPLLQRCGQWMLAYGLFAMFPLYPVAGGLILRDLFSLAGGNDTNSAQRSLEITRWCLFSQAICVLFAGLWSLLYILIVLWVVSSMTLMPGLGWRELKADSLRWWRQCWSRFITRWHHKATFLQLIGALIVSAPSLSAMETARGDDGNREAQGRTPQAVSCHMLGPNTPDSRPLDLQIARQVSDLTDTLWGIEKTVMHLLGTYVARITAKLQAGYAEFLKWRQRSFGERAANHHRKSGVSNLPPFGPEFPIPYGICAGPWSGADQAERSGHAWIRPLGHETASIYSPIIIGLPLMLMGLGLALLALGCLAFLCRCLQPALPVQLKNQEIFFLKSNSRRFALLHPRLPGNALAAATSGKSDESTLVCELPPSADAVGSFKPTPELPATTSRLYPPPAAQSARVSVMQKPIPEPTALLHRLLVAAHQCKRIVLKPSAPRDIPWNIGWASIKGPVRLNNEDYVLAFEIAGCQVVMMADGVGGEPWGEQASYYAIQSATWSIMKQLGGGDTPLQPSPEAVAAKGLYSASRALQRMAASIGCHQGLRTTLIIAVAAPTCYGYAYIGDGKLSILRAAGGEENVLIPQRGEMDPGNVINACLGPRQMGEPVIGALPRNPSDFLIMGTDGAFCESVDLGTDYAKRLLQAAFHNQGNLNRTVEAVLQELSGVNDQAGYLFQDNLTMALLGDGQHPILGPGFWTTISVPPKCVATTSEADTALVGLPVENPSPSSDQPQGILL